MDNKLEFSLVPVSGTLRSGGGFRAKFGAKREKVLDTDDVLQEAKESGAFFGVSMDLAKLIVRGVLQSMIEKTAADGKTRRIDDYLSVSLKLHGRFDSEDEDFDESKHELALSLRPLVKFRPKFRLQPVNVNRKKQFRIYSIAPADGSHSGGEVVWCKDFRIKGAEMLRLDGTAYVTCSMKTSEGAYCTVDPQIVSHDANEIVCHWPSEFAGEHYSRGWMTISVNKDVTATDPREEFVDREKRVCVCPE